MRKITKGKYAVDINSIEDLYSSLITNELEKTNNRIRGLIIVPLVVVVEKQH